MEYSLRVLTKIEEIDKLKTVWSNLSSRLDNPRVIYNDLDYLKFQISEDVLEGNLLIFILYEDGIPKLIVSGQTRIVTLSPSLAYFKLSFLKTHKKCYYIFPYAIFGELNSEQTVRKFLNSILSILKKNDVDYVFFSLIPEKSTLAKYLLEYPNPLVKDHFPIFDNHYMLQTPADLETFLSTRNANSRQKFKRLIRRVDKDFGEDIMVKIYTSLSEIALCFEDAEIIAQKCQLRALNLGFRATAEELKKKMWLASNGYFRGYILYVDKIPVSFILGINYKSNFYLEYTGLTLEYEKYQLGTYLYLKMIEDISKNGIADNIDFTHGSDLYKKILSSSNIKDIRIRLYIPKISNILFNLNLSFSSLLNKFGRVVLKKTGYYSKVRKGIRDKLKKKYQTSL
jgi:hypothetical protein